MEALNSAIVMMNNGPNAPALPLHIQDVVDSIFRDVNDRRRWYVTFKSYDLKQKFAAGGYHIGDTHIPPEYGDVHAFIPDPPFYLDEADLVSIISTFGDVVEHRSSSTNGVRTGSFHFSMNLKESMHLPEYFSVDGHLFQVINKNSLKQCSFCDTFGHIRREERRCGDEEEGESW